MTNITRARASDTIPLGGLLIGLFDLIFAFTFYGLILGVPLLRIFQTVAAGVLGRPRSYAGGVRTFLLGIVLHFVVATCIATVYYLATLVLPVLIRHPIVSGFAVIIQACKRIIASFSQGNEIPVISPDLGIGVKFPFPPFRLQPNTQEGAPSPVRICARVACHAFFVPGPLEPCLAVKLQLPEWDKGVG